MLTPYLPYPLLSGGQIRTYNLIKKLARKHEITLFALIKEQSEQQHVGELEKYCKRVKVFKRSNQPFTLKNILHTAVSSYPFLVIRNHVPKVIEAVKQELTKSDFDLIHAETFYMMPHLPKTDIPTILVEQTIEYVGYESYAQKTTPLLRPLLNIDINKIKRWEQHYWNLCHTLIVMSEEDRDYIKPYVKDPEKIKVVANGVDTAWFSQKDRQQTNQPTILSVGTFKWLPNVEAVTFLVEKVWPKIKAAVPKAKLWIVGNAPTQKILEMADADPSVSVTGNIPDIRDAFTGADILIAPVFSGKGTRYKVLEAMASGTPIVATTTAVEGLSVKHNEHVMIDDTASGMADSAVKLLQDPAKRRVLAHNGKIFVKKYYDWSLISDQLDKIYRSIGESRSSRSKDYAKQAS
jgi:polysaccharide biosynthesis protein PslH